MEAGGAYRSASLDAPGGEDREATGLAGRLGSADANFDLIEHRVVIERRARVAARAGADDPQAAVLRGPHADRDRGAGRRQPDARVATARAQPREPAPAVAERRFLTLSGIASVRNPPAVALVGLVPGRLERGSTARSGPGERARVRPVRPRAACSGPRWHVRRRRGRLPIRHRGAPHGPVEGRSCSLLRLRSGPSASSWRTTRTGHGRMASDVLAHRSEHDSSRGSPAVGADDDDVDAFASLATAQIVAAGSPISIFRRDRACPGAPR